MSDQPGSAPVKAPLPDRPGSGPASGALDRYFRITERGSTLSREVRGGFATFFAMAYIIVLNPIILGSAKDMYGNQLDNGQLVTATALTAAFTTLLMGVIGNVPIALAAGLGVNSVVALQLAPRMSWPDAMGMVVLAGFVVMLLVATGLRERVMNAVPYGLRKAIAIGIGLFIMLIGLVDSGFVTRMPDAAETTVPLQLGTGGHLDGWPVLVFVLGALLTLALIVRRVPGAILLSIVVMTVVAVVINAVADVPSWGLTTPTWPGNPVATPDFGLIGQVSLFGGFAKVGVLTGVLFVFTVLLSCFFDAMGTIMGVSDEAKLTDAQGQMPGINKVLFIDGVAVAAGGASSSSATTAFVESTAGVGEGARTGFANVVTGGLFAVALFLTPVATMVPSQAATPALLAVGFLILAGSVKEIDWADHTIAVPAFVTMVMMPFTYSITNGIGMGFITFAVLRLAAGRGREVPPAMYAVAGVFAFYYLMPALGLT
ncbi:MULTISPECIES: NCS2 family permease [Streptomyces]|jgi:AGZA family xanthine/uracil permease-like MFS transporter|uniref:MFS transporter n=2 Tax=Streptomyces TaxID=1883 RepID=A0A514JQB2_9ACTN|nr:MULTISPECIES: NCS2 family permease [Streptomyces]MBA8946270.1 AGZA family xanthine/uracil permease-like MFS transporter [Streptomyces calvus]MBA8977699.1 AGZA family xanthine/uracil permease-like MFS transporter [Streptomyces calvus]MYS26676.1 NCS2 family permease [Streptomyces sp. SID7804]QDI69531.1 MFS transporter [Streptomyces calvus]GGP49126.1 MFS transporter [Streptomyces calvus]